MKVCPTMDNLYCYEPCHLNRLVPFFFPDWYFAAVDNIMLAIYTVEVVVRMYVWRKDYFKEGWYMLGMI